MKKRFLFMLLTAAIVIATSAGNGGFAAPLPNAALSHSFSKTSAVTKVQYACGWTYSCTNLGNGGNGPQNVQIYGPVNVYTGADVKPEVWRVPEGAWPWTGDQGSQPWRGWGCGGHPCDERCGAFCWFNRVRNGYCGHGCNAYRQHVMFQRHVVFHPSDELRPYIYQNPSDGDFGGYGYGSGGASYYGSGYGQTSASQGGYGEGYSGQGGYGYSGATAAAIITRTRSSRTPTAQGLRPPRVSASSTACGDISTEDPKVTFIPTAPPSVTTEGSASSGRATTSRLCAVSTGRNTRRTVRNPSAIGHLT